MYHKINYETKKCTFIQNKLKDERISSCCPGPGIDVLGGIRPQATVPTKCVRIRIVRRFFDHCTTPIPQRLLTADPQSIMFKT